MNATELADYLVKKGVPFRTAHDTVGRAVLFAAEDGRELNDLSFEDFRLFSEDVEPSNGRLLGNFPQAYTHVGLIHAAITIGELLDSRTQHFRAWS